MADFSILGQAAGAVLGSLSGEQFRNEAFGATLKSQKESFLQNLALAQGSDAKAMGRSG